MLGRESFLDELETLTHSERVRRMVDVGRRAADGDHPAAALLRRLEAGDVYERYLALQAGFGSRDGARALRALGDPSGLVRGLARRLVPLVCDDGQAVEAVERLNRRERKSLMTGLLRAGRRAPIDAFLERLVERADPDLTRRLPFASAVVVARHLDATMLSAGSDDWRRLARHHAALAADQLDRLLAQSDEVDARLGWVVRAVASVLAHREPGRALALVRAVTARGVAPARLDLHSLVRRRPSEVADLVLAGDAVTSVYLAPRVGRLADDQIMALQRRHPSVLGPATGWLGRLSAARRGALYARTGLTWRDAEGVVPAEVVGLLPREHREREARRHLGLGALAARPQQRLPYAAFLPWDEAGASLERFIRNPDADLRAGALAALVGAARYQRDRLGELLRLLRARRNEQDPVRLAFVAALAALPPGGWRDEHLADLGGLLREALDAADLSAATAAAAERLVVQLLPRHPAWAVDWLATLVRERGHLAQYGLAAVLTDDDVRRLAPVLVPVLRDWRGRERSGALASFAGALGTRLRVFDDLVEMLEDVVLDTLSLWSTESILRLLREHRPDRIARLVPQLLARDPTWERSAVVYEHLHRRRQDLLTPHLGQHAYRGRFSDGATRFVIPVLDGFHRWTRRQQATFAATLATLTEEETRDTPALLLVMRQLAAMPAIRPDRLIQLASAGNGRLAVRDAALLALARLDAGQGVPTLLDALGDDRARVAIFALRAAILAMPSDRALDVLRGVPLDRVTVAKEVVRLIGELRTDAAYAELRAWHARELHRDVRVALLRAFWDYPERAETWDIFEVAARDADPAVAAGVIRVPADRLRPEGQRRLAGVLALLLRHSEPRVRLDALERCAALPLPDRERALLAPVLGALGSEIADEVRAAARAAFATYVGRDAPLVGRAAATMLPDRRALQILVQTLEGQLTRERATLLPTVRALIGALAVDPLTATLRARLAATALPWAEAHTVLAELDARGELHADALAEVMQVLRSVARRRADELASFEAALATSEGERLRRLALAVLVSQADARGWDDEQRARLEAYRADRSLLVASAAQFTLPPEA